MKATEILYDVFPAPLMAAAGNNVEITSIQINCKIGDETCQFFMRNKAVTDVELKLKGEPLYRTSLSNIVMMETDTGKGGGTNNKIVYFRDRGPGVLVNFSFKKDIAGKLHLTEGELVRVNRWCWVNPSCLLEIGNGKFRISYIDADMQRVTRDILCSRRMQQSFKKCI